jgi:hypothetical protein
MTIAAPVGGGEQKKRRRRRRAPGKDGETASASTPADSGGDSSGD